MQQTVIVFTAGGDEAVRHTYTWAVLYGIFPAVLLGAAVSAARLWWMRRPLAALREAQADPESLKDLRAVYRFRDAAQVEMLSRVMRRWDEDGAPEPDAIALGEFILKCGMARFPGNAALLVALANVHLAAHHDGQAARTQLQLAVKAAPSLIERYFVFATQDLSKKLKDEGGGLDLMGYIEFQRCAGAERCGPSLFALGRSSLPLALVWGRAFC